MSEETGKNDNTVTGIETFLICLLILQYLIDGHNRF